MRSNDLGLLHVYMYLDKDGIESLYAQTVKRLETEFKKSREQNTGRKVTGKVSLGTILGLKELGSDVELTGGGKHLIEQKSQLTVEHKLAALLEYLTAGQNQQCYRDLAKAAAFATSSAKGAYVFFEEEFNLPQFYLYRDGVEQVNFSGTVEFEIGPLRGLDTYDYSDQYFRRKKQYQFYMNASLSKFPGCPSGHMGATSHEAIIFRGHEGKDVPLGVLGYLTHVTKLSFYIKPFAIWQ